MSEKKTYLRFPVAQRIEHLVLILSFGTLALTGLIQKFPLNPICAWLLATLGGVEAVRIIHRVAATIMMVQTAYHVILVGYKLYVQRLSWTMLPGVQDAKDGIQAFLFNVGLSKKHPHMGRYNFAEKAEYWAMIWGTLIMGLTGFILWNPIFTAKLLPGQFIPAAKAAHGAEAILAVLAILVWHFYNVHLKKLNLSMLHGKLSQEEMEEEHAREMEEIDAGKVHVPDPEGERKRLRVFIPVASVLTVLMGAGIIAFLTVEHTSIATLPPVQENLTIYVPQTATPSPTAKPTPAATPTPEGGAAAEQPAALTWDNGVADLFKSRCSACHGAAGGFNVASYADVMNGGSSGAVILPGDAENSPLVKLQTGQHPGLFKPEELEKVKAWIAAGAPEK
jgi:cytochrome b subunit of formate dehydrogenase